MSNAISILALISTGIIWLPIAALYSAILSSLSFFMIFFRSVTELFGWNSENYIEGKRLADWANSVVINILKFPKDFVSVPNNVWNWSQENEIGSIIISIFFIYIILRFKSALYAFPIAVGVSFFIVALAVSLIIPMVAISYVTNIFVPFNQWDFSWINKELFNQIPMFTFTLLAIFAVLFVLFKIFAFWTDKRADRNKRKQIEFETGERSYDSVLWWKFIEILFFLVRAIAVIAVLFYFYSRVSGGV